MNGSAVFLFGITLALHAGRAQAQTTESVSYLLDGKKFVFTDVKLEYYAQDGYIRIEGSKTDRVDLGEDIDPRYREAVSSVSIDIVPERASFVGVHSASTSDLMPVYVSWYEVDKEAKEVLDLYASMDSGDESVLNFTVTIANFGPKGSLVQGVFSGKLLDEQGRLHLVTEGKFAVKRQDID